MRAAAWDAEVESQLEGVSGEGEQSHHLALQIPSQELACWPQLGRAHVQSDFLQTGAHHTDQLDVDRDNDCAAACLWDAGLRGISRQVR